MAVNRMLEAVVYLAKRRSVPTGKRASGLNQAIQAIMAQVSDSGYTQPPKLAWDSATFANNWCGDSSLPLPDGLREAASVDKYSIWLRSTVANDMARETLRESEVRGFAARLRAMKQQRRAMRVSNNEPADSEDEDSFTTVISTMGANVGASLSSTYDELAAKMQRFWD